MDEGTVAEVSALTEGYLAIVLHLMLELKNLSRT
jgi:hypothetical protein